MFKAGILVCVATLFFASSVFACHEDMASPDGKACGMIAKACLDAGFTQKDSTDKRFWQDCMKPIVLGKTVKDVNVDAATVKSCRTQKIKEMKAELKELKKASH